MNAERRARCSRRMRLRPDVLTATGAGGEVVLLHDSRWGEHFGVLAKAETAALRMLADGMHPETDLRSVLASGGAADSTLLGRLTEGGWLIVRFGHAQRPLVTVRQLGPHRAPRPASLVAPRLSRFAVLRRDGDAMVLESPLARAAVTVHDTDVLAVIHRLAGEQNGSPAVGLSPDIVAEVVAELAWYGFVHEGDGDARPDLSTQQWSAHELWFHSRSREGYHDHPSGGTFWARDRFDPLPARHEPWSSSPVTLPKPDGTADTDPSLGTVLDTRRSIRTHDPERPLTVAQLGEFLYRTARVTTVGVDSNQQVTLRPVPSGGAQHGLEIYPVVTTVTGLAAGMYHYDPFEHRLEPVPANEFATRQLVARAAGAAGGLTARPQVLLVLSCRFGRVMWKYQGMGYALILKDVGALYQTMYLVATAMGLAPCALGTGDTELFAQATGLDQLTEASVGEFLLGSRPPE